MRYLFRIALLLFPPPDRSGRFQQEYGKKRERRDPEEKLPIGHVQLRIDGRADHSAGEGQQKTQEGVPFFGDHRPFQPTGVFFFGVHNAPPFRS